MEIISLLWNEIILNPMENGLILIYAYLGRNFGITILIFTVLVRVITLPLTLKQTRSTLKMSQLQPRLQALQKRYTKDRTRLSQETMRLYKESGVNPIGCLGPMIIQFPVWIGLYISIIALLPTKPEDLPKLANHLYSWLPIAHEVVPLSSHFLWLDLALPDKTPVMPVLVGISMWLLQKMSTPAVADPKQASTNRMLLWMMPFMFAFFTISLPSGLPVYWLISNVIGIVIQGFVTGWGELLFFRNLLLRKKESVPVPAIALDVPSPANAPSLATEETSDEEQDGTGGDQRQDDRGGHRSRAQRARRRARGSHNRGR